MVLTHCNSLQLPDGVLSYCPTSYRLATLRLSPGPLPGVGGRHCGEKPIERTRRCASRPSLVRRASEIERVPSLRPNPIMGALPPHSLPFANFRLRSLLRQRGTDVFRVTSLFDERKLAVWRNFNHD
jgi:hypothetical protein